MRTKMLNKKILFILVLIGLIYLSSEFSKSKTLKKAITNNITGNNDIKFEKYFNYSNPKKLVEDQYDAVPVINEVTSPLVYIYNTHQTETYSLINNLEYNVNPTVITASNILRESLKRKNITSIVEDKSIKKVLNKNNWKYGYSYKVSRTFLEEVKEKNPSIMYYIDVHRDSGSHDKTTIEVNGVMYAKVLLVVGLDYENYEENLYNANKLNNIINSKISGLSRGVLKKSGKGVNGIYNQDFANNVFLIEIGGQYNYIEEIKNTIDILADSIYDYINNDEKEKT